MSAAQAGAPNLLFRTYRQLRRQGEQSDFLRRCVSVYDKEACSKAAAGLLRAHRLVNENAVQRAAAPWYRPDRKVRLAVQGRVASARLYWRRSVLNLGNFISDVIVVVTVALCAYVVLQSFTVLRIAMGRLELLEIMVAPILEAMHAIEDSAAGKPPASPKA